MSSEWNETCSQAPCNKMTPTKILAELLQESQAEAVFRHRDVKAAFDELSAENQRLKAELAAERERCSRYNEMAGKDADELARLREQIAALDAALDARTSRLFPIQRGIPVPWAEAEKAYITYARLFGNEQSLERLAERGGFGIQEFLCLWHGHMPDRHEHEWISFDQAARDADQRRKGAVWALRDLAAKSKLPRIWNASLLAWIDGQVARIERGEVEVGGE